MLAGCRVVHNMHVWRHQARTGGCRSADAAALMLLLITVRPEGSAAARGQAGHRPDAGCRHPDLLLWPDDLQELSALYKWKLPYFDS